MKDLILTFVETGLLFWKKKKGMVKQEVTFSLLQNEQAADRTTGL